jgi:DNA-binding NarL/FixJ family response regulator
MRILLADDHPVVRRHVREILQSEIGWEVCAEAATGREAVLLTAREHPDIVVLDLSMPELTGLQAAKLIHQHFPETEMIVLTMHEPSGLRSQLAESGVRACLQKTDLQDLLDTVRDVWESRATASET